MIEKSPEATGRMITTQKEWDAIPKSFKGAIILSSKEPLKIESDCRRSSMLTVVAINRTKVTAAGHLEIEAQDEVEVTAFDMVRVEAAGKAHVSAHDHVHVVAFEEATIDATDSTYVEASDNVCVNAGGWAQIIARDNVLVGARGSAAVSAYGSAAVRATEQSRVDLHECAFGVLTEQARAAASDRSVLIASGHAIAHAYNRASVHALGYASVEAWGQSRVWATQFSRVVLCSPKARATIRGHAILIRPPKSAREFCRQQGIRVQGNTAVLYTPKDDWCPKTKGKPINLPYPVVVADKATAVKMAVFQARRNPRVFEVAVRLSDLDVTTLSPITTVTRLMFLREVPRSEWGVWATYANLMARDSKCQATV